MSLFKSAATISALTLASRITGVIRDMLIARYFGATAATDAFYVAFRLPNMLRRLFAEGAFQQAFVPMLSDVHANSSPEAEKRFIDHVFTVLAAAVLLASVLGVLAAPLLVWLIASGLRETPQAFDLAAALTRVMFPYIAFMSLVALAASILNTLKKFAIPAATPILLNLSFIVCSVVLAPRLEEPIWALAAAVVLGGVLQLAAQILALARLGVFVRPRSLKESLGDSAVRRVLALMAPAVFGVGVAQLSILINTNIASWLGHGAVTWLNYADRLMEFPTALLGVALGTVLLPSLSAAYAKGNEVRYNALLDHGLRLVVLVGVPAAVAALMKEFVKVKQSADLHTSAFDQAIIDRYMDEYSLDDHVAEINKLYKHRRDLLLKTMEETFTDGTTWTHPEGGLFLWLTFPEGVSARKVFDKCIEKNVAGVLGEFFYPNIKNDRHMRINYSNMPDDRIVEGVRRMAEALKEIKEGK